MSELDSVGTYIGTVLASALGTTKKSGFPQAVFRLRADKKYINDPANMAHFQLTEPGYVPWVFDGQEPEELDAYLVLFNSKDGPFIVDKKDPGYNAMMNYEQLQLATGWDGTEFESFADGTMVSKQILFRVEEGKPYTDASGKEQPGGKLQVNWVDAIDASPERTLKSLDLGAIGQLTAKLKIGAKAPTAASAPAKPAGAAAGKPGKPAAGKPAASTPPSAPASPAASSTPVPPSAPAPVTTGPTTTSPSSTAPPKTPKKEKTPAAPAAGATVFPPEVTQADAWAAVMGRKGDKDDTAIQDAWIAASQEVGGEKDDDELTNAEWAKVRDTVIAKLGL